MFLCALSPATAVGAFPGGDGQIATVYDQFDRGGGFDLELRLLDHNGRIKARFSNCTRPDESEPAPGDCPADPAFSPDGRTIAHSLGRRLALQSVVGGRPFLLPALTQWDRDPYPSPDGSGLVFTGRAGGKSNVFTVDTDGRGLRQITRAGGHSPAWSSRGEIAYAAHGKIWRLKPGGKRVYVATGAGPDWSPSGGTIGYVLRGSIYRVGTRRTGRRQLVHGRALSIAFSPDGRSIAYVRGYPMDLGGALFSARSRDAGGMRRIASGGEQPTGSTWLGWDRPSWQPTPASSSISAGRSAPRALAPVALRRALELQ